MNLKLILRRTATAKRPKTAPEAPRQTLLWGIDSHEARLPPTWEDSERSELCQRLHRSTQCSGPRDVLCSESVQVQSKLVQTAGLLTSTADSTADRTSNNSHMVNLPTYGCDEVGEPETQCSLLFLNCRQQRLHLKQRGSKPLLQNEASVGLRTSPARCEQTDGGC